MAQKLENALNTLYRNHGTNLLQSHDYFVQSLETIYQPEWKADFNLLDKGSRAGMGAVAEEFAKLGRVPTEAERDRMALQLMTAAPGLYEKDAARIVALYAAMLGWDATPKPAPWSAPSAEPEPKPAPWSTSTAEPEPEPKPKSAPRAKRESAPKQAPKEEGAKRAKGKLKPLDILGIVMLALGAFGIAYGIAITSSSGVSPEIAIKMFRLEKAFSGESLTFEEFAIIAIVQFRIYLTVGGAGVLFASQMLKKK